MTGLVRIDMPATTVVATPVTVIADAEVHGFRGTGFVGAALPVGATYGDAGYVEHDAVNTSIGAVHREAEVLVLERPGAWRVTASVNVNAFTIPPAPEPSYAYVRMALYDFVGAIDLNVSVAELDFFPQGDGGFVALATLDITIWVNVTSEAFATISLEWLLANDRGTNEGFGAQIRSMLHAEWLGDTVYTAPVSSG